MSLQKARKRKNTDDEDSEVKEKLKKLCYKNFDEVFRSISSDCLHREKQLALYTLLLHEALKSRDEKHLKLLSDHLTEFISFVVSLSASLIEKPSFRLIDILVAFVS